jgi:hypothetical protein
MVPRGLLALLLLVSVLVGAIVWVTTQARSAQAQEPPAVRVTSSLPPWVAPRARIRFRGRATPGATV